MSGLDEEVRELRAMVERLGREVEELKRMLVGRGEVLPSPINSELIEALLGIFRGQFGVEGRGGVAFVGSVEWSEGVVKKSFFSAIPVSDVHFMDPVRLAEMAAPLSNENRVRILQLLLDGPKSSSELSSITGLEGGQLYHHLKELMFAGFIGSVERGKYRLTERGLMALRVLSALASTPGFTVHQ